MKRWLILSSILLVDSIIPLAQSREEALHEYFSALDQNQQFSGNVLIAERGKIVYERSFGYADFPGSVLNTNQTSFPIASLSKTLTATAVFQLAQAGKLSLSDAVTQHLRRFPYPEIKILHLLSHTSGLPSYNAYFNDAKKNGPARIFTNVDLIDGIVTNKKPLIYRPGEKGNYDNINYIVLALIIEQISGLPYVDYVEKYILKPAGMVNTRFVSLRSQYTQRHAPGFAFPHLRPHRYSDSLVKASTVPYVVDYWSAYNFSGFGDYVSTTHDLLNYDNAYYTDSLISKMLLALAFTPFKLTNGDHTPGNFGLGWQIAKDTTLGNYVYHSGAATGLSCILLRNISKNQTIILFNNINYNAQALALNALKILNGKPVDHPKKSIVKRYAKTLLHYGAVAARDTVNALKKDTANFILSENEMNLLGYDFMGGSNNPNPFHFPEERRYQEALATFQLNTELFPESWNVYDSYGEILLKTGDKEEAIRMYKRSIELNPKNEGGRKVLEALEK